MRKSDKALRDPHQNLIPPRRRPSEARWLQAEIFRELLADFGYRRDSRGLTELRQLAWDRAIAIKEAEMREG